MSNIAMYSWKGRGKPVHTVGEGKLLTKCKHLPAF